MKWRDERRATWELIIAHLAWGRGQRRLSADRGKGSGDNLVEGGLVTRAIKGEVRG